MRCAKGDEYRENCRGWCQCTDLPRDSARMSVFARQRGARGKQRMTRSGKSAAAVSRMTDELLSAGMPLQRRSRRPATDLARQPRDHEQHDRSNLPQPATRPHRGRVRVGRSDY